MPTKTWAVGEEVLAADFNTYVQRQIVATFANAAARDAAISAPTAGMVCYLNDTQALQLYTAGAWVNIGGTTKPAYGQITATSGNFAQTALAITGLAGLPFTVPAGRRVKVTASGSLNATTPPTLIRPAIYQDGVQVALALVNMSTAFNHFTLQAILTPAAGAHSYALYCLADVGQGNVQAGATNPAFIMAEDIGGA